jgi:hypothetical protein
MYMSNISNSNKNKNITNLLKEKLNLLCTLIPNKTKHKTLFTRELSFNQFSNHIFIDHKNEHGNLIWIGELWKKRRIIGYIQMMIL